MSDKDKAANLFQEAMEEFVGQNYGRSVDLLNQALDADPDHKLAHMSRGAACLKLDRTLEAIDDFNWVIDNDPNYARAWHLRGLGHEKTGNDQDALSDFNRAIEIDPQYGAAYYSRATLHTKLGDTDSATADARMVTHLTELNIQSFSAENNIWRSQHLKLEESGAADVMNR
jgi:tetratricopeptide (TPR) repeat protein